MMGVIRIVIQSPVSNTAETYNHFVVAKPVAKIKKLTAYLDKWFSYMLGLKQNPPPPLYPSKIEKVDKTRNAKAVDMCFILAKEKNS